MCSVKIVFAVFAWTTVANYVFVSGQKTEDETKEPEEKTDPPPVENHTFVALIEVLFEDKRKRQCTGTIVHNKVVVTAAHCFVNNANKDAEIELASSFVVIGTKKMFDTGYENYLPIERIVTHPRYKGWTADLALVFTFAAMTDKSGHAIPLVEEYVTTPVDSNVTILSWGRCANDEAKQSAVTKWPGDKKRHCTSSEEENDSCEQTSTNKPLRTGSPSSQEERSSEASRLSHRSYHGYKSDVAIVDLERVTPAHNSQRAIGVRNMQRISQIMQPLEPLLNVNIGVNNKTINIGSSHVVTAEENVKEKENMTRGLRRHRKHRNFSQSFSIVNVEDQKWPQDQLLVERRGGLNTSLDGNTTMQSYYKNLRRQDKTPANKDNTLTVETFGFVNVQTCKKLVEKVLSTQYRINTNEVVCYAADEHYISDDDSGAPAIRNGRLVAVTVGGVECDGDHVAVGMKMNCFCSWIADNLPEANVDWKCCKDCCMGDESKNPQKHKHKA